MSPVRSLLGVFLLSVLLLSVWAQAPKARGVDQSILAPLPGRIIRRMCATFDIREITGQCTSRGMANFGQARRAQFSYVLGHTSEFATGQGLRSPRDISNIVFNQDPSENIPNRRRLNQLFVFFGQFLDHNFALTPTGTKEMNIPIPSNDPKLRGKNLPFLRSRRGPTNASRNAGERPINSLTSAVDLDAVYGASEMRALELSEVNGNVRTTGKLRVERDNLLPLNRNGFVNSPTPSGEFFIAGDTRANEHIALTAMHTIFLREHNRLVDMITGRVSSLSGEEIYQVARAMNIAQFQKIVFEQFYPALIGRNLRRYAGHRRNVNPTVSDIFAAAAFRIGHTMVDNTIPLRGPSGPLPPVPARMSFFRKASEFSSTKMDNVIRGISNTLAQEVDVKIVDTLRNQLFQFVDDEEGFDLISLNLQRGRDHAIPTYNEIRQIFRLPKATSFSDITRNAEVAAKLSEAYNDKVDDVEAFPGLLAEDHAPGSGVGETMRAVWDMEFTRVRDGDQYFYLNRGAFPEFLETNFADFVSQIRAPQPNLLRDIIVRNSGVTASQLPPGNIFTA